MPQARILLRRLFLHEDENTGDTHVGVFANVGIRDARGAFIRTHPEYHFRWNHDGTQISENEGPLEEGSYDLAQAAPLDPSAQVVRVSDAPTLFIQAYANDDRSFPGPGTEVENYLGGVTLSLDPTSPNFNGAHRTGRSRTDEGNDGFSVGLTIQAIPDPPPPPELIIHGIEVAQCVQSHGQDPFHKRSSNPVSLVAHRTTLVRAYLEAGTAGADASGRIAGITGTLTFDGNVLNSLNPMEARRWSDVDMLNLEHTLNFLIPAKLVRDGTFDLRVTAIAPANPTRAVFDERSVKFNRSVAMRIRMLRLRTDTALPRSAADCRAAAEELLKVFPVSSEPARGLEYALHPAIVLMRVLDRITFTLRPPDLDDESDRNAMLDQLEDLQEDYDDDSIKVFGMLPDGVSHRPTSRESDNVALGAFRSYELAHEIGHLYGLEHANCGEAAPDPVDPGYGDGTLLGLGYALSEVANTATVIAKQGPKGGFVKDMMGYCRDDNLFFSGVWVGVHSWELLRARLGA